MKVTTDPRIDAAFDAYPTSVKAKMERLRALVHETAAAIPLDHLEETVKWGEPSFISTHGSTLRMDWKAKKPNQYAMYFKCTSRLVETFQQVFGATFNYEGKRAIIFTLDQDIPTKELKQCITATLLYHKVKGDLRLGI